MDRFKKIAYKTGLKAIINEFRKKYDEDFDGYEEMFGIGLKSTSHIFDEFEDAADNYREEDLAYSSMIGELVDDLEGHLEKVLKVMKVLKKEDDRASYYAMQLKNTIKRWLKHDLRSFSRYLIEEL